MKKSVIFFFICLLVTCSNAEDKVIYNGLSDGNKVISNINFSDVKAKPAEHWSKEAIYKMSGMGLISGFSNGTFAPSSSVTYEQAITLVIKSLGVEDEVNKATNVTANGSWSDKYIRYAMKNGIVTEKIVMNKSDIKSSTDINELKSSGVLIRNAAISREDVAKLVAKAFALTETTDINFYDNDQISSDNLNYVKNVVAAKIMNGTNDNMFNPNSSLTREEMAQILLNAEDMIVNKLHILKKSLIIDGNAGNNINGIDLEGNEISINIANKNIPVLKSGVLGGVDLINNNNEIECYINKNKQIIFINVIEEISDAAGDVTEKLNNTLQGTVVGNSPYFEEITIRNSNNEKQTFNYGPWTDFYKDGALVSSFDVEQGDTVYIELDEIDDVIEIRAVSNNIISFGTITDISRANVTVRMDETDKYKTYNLQNVYIYKEGSEIRYTDLVRGNYLKLFESETSLQKVEVLADKNTVENIYKGTISNVNLLQDTITLKSVSTYTNGKWSVSTTSFVTINLDNDVKVTFYGDVIDVNDLGNTQVGKEAYVITRADTKTLEKARVIRIDSPRSAIEIKDNVKDFDGEVLELDDYSSDIYIDDATIIIDNQKIIDNPDFSSDLRVYISAQRIDGNYVASIVEVMPYEEDEEIGVYIGTIYDIEDGKHVTLKVEGKYIDDEWDSVRKKYANFIIGEESRIISSEGPINISEFSLDNENVDYDGERVCVVTKGDEIIELTVTDLTNEPLLIKGIVKKVNGSDITVSNVDYYDYEEDDWIYDNNKIITVGAETVIIKNGEKVKQSKIEVGKDILVFKVADEADKTTGVVMIFD